MINSRANCEQNNITENDLPENIVYAVKDNKDQNTIRDAMFLKHLQQKFSRDPYVRPPVHTICILVSKLEWKTALQYYIKMFRLGQNIIHKTCYDDIWADNVSKCIDPNLKLYYNHLIILINNINVKEKNANGSMGRFKGITFKNGLSMADLDNILVGGYCVQCVQVNNIIQIELDEDVTENDYNKIINIEAKEFHAQVKYPITFESTIKHNTLWQRGKGLRLTQFPLIIAHVRTVYKLQGRSIINLIMRYSGN